MATFVDQVKEMGFKQATIAKLDDVVERLTSGLNINDVRAMLRGDEPRRPNPMPTVSGCIFAPASTTRKSPTSTRPSAWAGCRRLCLYGKRSPGFS